MIFFAKKSDRRIVKIVLFSLTYGSSPLSLKMDASLNILLQNLIHVVLNNNVIDLIRKRLIGLGKKQEGFNTTKDHC